MTGGTLDGTVTIGGGMPGVGAWWAVAVCCGWGGGSQGNVATPRVESFCFQPCDSKNVSQAQSSTTEVSGGGIRMTYLLTHRQGTDKSLQRPRHHHASRHSGAAHLMGVVDAEEQ